MLWKQLHFDVVKTRQFKSKQKVARISFLSPIAKQGFEPLRRKAQISKRERVCACTSEPRAACSPRWLVADERSAKHQAPSACTAKGVRFKFIQATGLAYHHRAKCGVYHQPLRGCISSRAGVYFPCGLMIYNTSCW